MTIELILGGARSGKTALAEKRAQQLGQDVIYLATAQAGDAEMAERILQHQRKRPAHWGLVEEPLCLAAALWTHASTDRVLLVDCLTLWVSNLLMDTVEPTRLIQEKSELFSVLPRLPGSVIFVGNETGLGIIPLGLLNRRFVDEMGWLHQSLADLCDRVVLTVAGLPLVLKD